MAIIAVADIETGGAVKWAAEDLGATFPEVLSGINLYPECNVYICVCNRMYMYKLTLSSCIEFEIIVFWICKCKVWLINVKWIYYNEIWIELLSTVFYDYWIEKWYWIVLR